jgi:hypothetical protein
MRTYIANIIPRIQQYSKKLDDLTRLTNQHWVSIDDIGTSKRVFIFRPNNQLLISENGIVERGSWDYLGNQSLLIETKNESYLLKHGFFDNNVIALKLDSTEQYAFFVNETKYSKELNTIDDILDFLEKEYITHKNTGLGATNRGTINEEIKYKILSEVKKHNAIWGNHIEYEIDFLDGMSGKVYKGGSSNMFFHMDYTFGKKYFKTIEETIIDLYMFLRQS